MTILKPQVWSHSHCTLGCVEPEVTMSGQEGGAGEDILIVSDGGAENTQG